MTCRKMIGIRWGLNPKIMEWLYTSVIRPILAYGSIVTAGALDTKLHIKKLNKIQRLACTMILNATHSTPTAGMEAILGLQPLHIYMKTKALTESLRIQKHNHWRPKTGESLWKSAHSLHLNKWKKQIKDLVEVTDSNCKTSCTQCLYTTQIKNREELEHPKKKPQSDHTNQIHCFTDG